MDQELREYLDRQFGEVGRQLGVMERRFADMEGRLADVEGGLAEVKLDLGELRKDLVGFKQDVDGRFVEVKDEIHLTRILVEKLNDKIDLVAEGVRTNTEVMHRHREENRQELREFREVMEAAHRHLERRVSGHDDDLERLDNRVTFLEARKA